MVVALCAPAARDEQDKAALARVLGADPDEAFGLAADLLSHPHPLVAAAAGLWVDTGRETPTSKAWQAALPGVVETGDVPTQAALDAWATEHTLGLIKRFPLKLTPKTVCLLASVPFEVVDAAELAPSAWSARVRSVLRAPRRDRRHRQFLARTEGAGTLCVHLAGARGGLVVGSVIAADDGVPSRDVLAVAEEIVTAEAATPGSTPPLPLRPAPRRGPGVVARRGARRQREGARWARRARGLGPPRLGGEDHTGPRS